MSTPPSPRHCSRPLPLRPEPCTGARSTSLLRQGHGAVVERVDGGGRAAVVALVVVGRERVVDRPRALADVARPRGRRADLAVLVGGVEAQVVDPPGVALAGDDVDRAGDRPGAGLGGRRAQDLDPLDLVGRERIEREARRHALAVEQDLGVAAAEAAQPDRAAAAGPALDRDAGQALEHVAQGGVAEAVDLLAADDDLGGGRLAPLLDVVGAGAGDVHRRQLLRRRRRRRRVPARPPRVPDDRRCRRARLERRPGRGPRQPRARRRCRRRGARPEGAHRRASRAARAARARFLPSGQSIDRSLACSRAGPQAVRICASLPADRALELRLVHGRAALDVLLRRFGESCW